MEGPSYYFIKVLLPKYSHPFSPSIFALLFGHIYILLLPWDLSKFGKTNHKWGDVESQRSFLDSVAKQLNITNPEGWYQISSKALMEQGAGGLLHNRSLYSILKAAYPKYLLMFEH